MVLDDDVAQEQGRILPEASGNHQDRAATQQQAGGSAVTESKISFLKDTVRHCVDDDREQIEKLSRSIKRRPRFKMLVAAMIECVGLQLKGRTTSISQTTVFQDWLHGDTLFYDSEDEETIEIYGEPWST